MTCWNATFARYCLEHFTCRRNFEKIKLFPVLLSQTKQNWPLCEAKVSVSSAMLRFCSPFHGAFSSWGSLHSRKSRISSVLLWVKWADRRGTGVLKSGKRYSDLTWLLPTGSGYKLTWVFSWVGAWRDVPWTSERGEEETWAWLALDSTAQCGAGSWGHFHPVAPCPSLTLGWEWCVGSLPAGTPYSSIPAGVISLLCRSRILFLITSCCTGGVMMPNNV